MSWFLIEALGPLDAPMTILAKDGERRDWVSLRSLQRNEGVDVTDAAEWVRHSGSVFDQVVSGRGGHHRVRILPIVGPEGEVYAMHLWAGAPDESIPAHRPAAGIAWYAGDLQVQQGLESWMMSTDDADGFKRVRSPGEFFRKVVKFDDATALIALGTNPTPGARFSQRIVVLHDNGRLMNWQTFAVGRTDLERPGLRGLTHDVSDVDPVSLSPHEALGLTDEPGPDSPAAALIAFPPTGAPLIAQWIGHVPTWIDWQREGDAELIHRDDWHAIAKTAIMLQPGLLDSKTVTPARIRAHTPSGWQPVTITSRRFPGEVGSRLHIVRIARAG
ncbi:GAF domain-containing protein [Nocardia sp. NPDC059764]|uniref:GAF domain-containing protein n=1 Tax=Nocardia sp. NPDC059764 TaxID=3346939 RepID=UPI00364EC988